MSYGQRKKALNAHIEKKIQKYVKKKKRRETGKNFNVSSNSRFLMMKTKSIFPVW